MNLNEYAQSAANKVLVYGAPKTGKTDFVGQLASTKKLWWFDLEDGIKTLLHSTRMKKEWFQNIEVFSIPDTQVFPVGVQTMLQVIKGGEKKICHTHGVVACSICTKTRPEAFSSINVSTFTNNDVLVIDSVSQLSNSAMNWIMRDAIAKDNYDAKADWDDYAKQGKIIDRIFSIMQQAPFNVVCISHEQLVEMEDGKKKIVPIGGTSNVSKTFAKYFDEVVYAEVLNKKHRFASSSGYSNSIVLGSRNGVQLENKETPSITDLFK